MKAADVTKLPRWAQDKIRNLESDLARAKKSADCLAWRTGKAEEYLEEAIAVLERIGDGREIDPRGAAKKVLTVLGRGTYEEEPIP